MAVDYSDPQPADKASVAFDRRFYTWTFPGAPVKVRLALNIVDEIRGAIGTDNPPNIGGGLLFGAVRHGAIVIDRARPIAHLNAGSVQEALRAPVAQVVGFYRVQPGNDVLRLGDDDVALVRRLFPPPNSVALLVQRGEGAPRATFFFWQGSDFISECALLEFPFDSELLAIEERGRAARNCEAGLPTVEITLPNDAAPRRCRRISLRNSALLAPPSRSVVSPALSHGSYRVGSPD